ncbi:MAG: FAD-dependent oxidoreductase [Idiomarina sp.]|nr:FAD-dependent oxidoreductase [Idiomarina sp.]
MQRAKIAIIGAGLSGLYAAYRLEQMGMHDYVVLEAAETPGGRIVSQPIGDSDSTQNRFDLGPTWYWPSIQKSLNDLIADLGLPSFAQFESGEMMVERQPDQLARRTQGYLSSPAAQRLAGGMQSLIDALYRQLDPGLVVTGCTVQSIERKDSTIEIGVRHGELNINWQADHVLLALPPRLAAERITFSPPLPEVLARQWQATATWMAPHAKYLAVYERAFWRQNGLSGAARSAVGPLVEVHDASMPGGNAALFGFIGISAHERQKMSQDELKRQCKAQLERLFGPAAAHTVGDFIKDWAQAEYVASAADRDGFGYHAAPPAEVDSGYWSGRLVGIASEWSPQFPGYLAGAIDAVDRWIVNHLPQNHYID